LLFLLRYAQPSRRYYAGVLSGFAAVTPRLRACSDATRAEPCCHILSTSPAVHAAPCYFHAPLCACYAIAARFYAASPCCLSCFVVCHAMPMVFIDFAATWRMCFMMRY
jgi:hypothetical protein